ncbi:MAG TPA: hypothetical protein VFA54_13680 [Bryobacterales bacterium]|nr:hypothetical protein [Bryobacterales bacterium]
MRGGFSGGRIGGGFAGGSFIGGGSFHGGFVRSGAFRGGFVRSGVFRGGFHPGFSRFGFRRSRVFFSVGLGFYPYSFAYWPFAYDYWWPYGYGYPYYYYPQYYYPPYDYSEPYPNVVGQQAVPAPGGAVQTVPQGYWLIALKDNTIIAATDYWLDGSTLHYVTRDGNNLTIPLDRVDLPFTRELNAERGAQFRLPRPSDTQQPARRDSYGRAY